MMWERKYENEEPFTDMFDAMDVLTHRWQDRQIRKAWSFPEYYLEKTFAPDFGYNRPCYYRISKELFGELKERHFIRGQPEWGYTSSYEFNVTEEGQKWFFEEARKRGQEDRARRMN